MMRQAPGSFILRIVYHAFSALSIVFCAGLAEEFHKALWMVQDSLTDPTDCSCSKQGRGWHTCLIINPIGSIASTLQAVALIGLNTTTGCGIALYETAAQARAEFYNCSPSISATAHLRNGPTYSAAPCGSCRTRSYNGQPLFGTS